MVARGRGGGGRGRSEDLQERVVAKERDGERGVGGKEARVRHLPSQHTPCSARVKAHSSAQPSSVRAELSLISAVLHTAPARQSQNPPILPRETWCQHLLVAQTTAGRVCCGLGAGQ
eukprot:3155576-Rhodomonas_salina.1